MHKTLSAIAALLIVLSPGLSLARQTAPEPDGAAAVYLDPTASAEVRAADLVSRMTLAEKASQIQHGAPAIPRLGVPGYNWWSEGLHGVARAGEATVFPQAIGMAATWDTDLIHDVAGVIGVEFRAKNLENRGADGSTQQYRGLTVWSPNVNIFRDPRWGRGQETWGEDPFLTSRFGVAFIEGLQGDDPLHPQVIAAVKHFAVHSGPEAGRHRDDIHPSPRDVTETYLPAFHAAITEAHAQALMCAYNAIDGVPVCANTDYLQRRLRTDWGFQGHVVSDCAAIADFYLPSSHAAVRTPEEAVALALKSGTDLICDFRSNGTFNPQATVNAVEQGLLPESVLDAAVRRLFTARMRLGLFDPPGTGPYAGIAATDYDTPAHRDLALRTARESLVLLKNDGLLPLRSTPRRIAVVGPNADTVEALVGNYNGTPSHPVTILDGLKARFPEAEIRFVEGTGWVAPPLEDVPDLAVCADADCARPGLDAEEFAGPDLSGAPVVSRTDPNAKFAWGSPVRQERESSIRWTGFLKVTEPGEYRFRYTGANGYRIFVDDALVADVWDAAWPTSDTAVDLGADRPHAIRIEAIQKGSRGSQKLQWSQPGSGAEPALRSAQDADLIVFVGGLTSKFEGEEMVVQAPGFAGGDRTSLDLPAPQQQLLERLYATGKPVVLVLANGSAMSVNWADAHLPAIIEAWYPGGQGGQAVAELIAGDFSPSGRLPVTFYRSADDLPPFADYGMDGRTYRRFHGAPLYPFGHGLSYTRFTYSALTLDHAEIAAGDAARVSVDVTNNGDREGAEVVQLYVSRPGDDAPVRSLAGFQRILLKAGETRRVTFDLSASAMSLVDASGQRSVPAGQVSVWVGGGQPVATRGGVAPAGLEGRLTVRGSRDIAPF
jgi:beta-glucosidase